MNFSIKYRINKSFFPAAVIYFSSFFAIAQQINSFQNLTSLDGLSQNSILQIIEDKYGFIWFGTRDGLNRYDGYKIDQFYNEPFNANSLSGNQIRTIIEDRDGNLVIGTVSGLSKYLIDQDKFIQISLSTDKSTKEPNIFSLLMYDSSTVWIGIENGLLSYNFELNTMKKIDGILITSPITKLHKDSLGDIWIATNNEMWKHKKDAPENHVTRITNQFINSRLWGPFFEDSNNRIWIGAHSGLFLCSPGSETIIPASETFPWIDQNKFKDISAFTETKEKQLWVGQIGGGVNVLDFEKKMIHNYSSREINEFNPASDNISSILADKAGRIWIGTNGAGVSFRNPNEFSFGLINHKNNIIINRSIRAVYKDLNDIIWIGGYNGLDKYSHNAGLIKHFGSNKQKKDLPKRTIYSITQDPADQNILWIGFEKGGFCKFNKTNYSYIYYPEKDEKFAFLKNESVVKILFDKHGFLWMGSNKGLLRLNRNLDILAYYGPYEDEKKINDDDISNLIEDVEGNIWASTSIAGINKIDPATGIIKSYINKPNNINSLISDRTYCLLQDAFGYIWIGTDSGLDRLDPATDNFLHLDIKSGLPNNSIYGILSDEYNNLWLSTNNGISKYDPKKNTFSNFDLRFNLQDKEFNFNAYHKGYDGELFFGGINGVNNFYPQKITGNNIFPGVYLTDLKIFNQSIKSGMEIDGKIILDKTITSTVELELKYYQNTISLEFAALEYFSNQYINYSYILENFEDNWNMAGTRRFASYVNLPPGDYIFKVKSTNLEGEWNTNATALTIIINPPVWLSLPAYIIYIFGFVMLIVLIYIHYMKKFRLKEIEVEKERRISEKLRLVDKLKDNFLAQISHEIRTPINTIFNYTNLLKENYSQIDDPDIEHGFEAIDLAGHRIIRTVELILNLSEVQSGSYIYSEKVLNISEDILEKVFNEFLLNAKRKGLKLLWGTKVPGLYIRGDEYSITQIVSNLVENAIKYTLEGQVRIGLRETGGRIFVYVEDTGIGISEEYLTDLFNPFSQESAGYTRKFDGNGLGLALVKKYCELNNIKISVSSKKGQGTIFTLEFLRFCRNP